MERLGRIGMLEGMLKQEPEDLFLNYALGIEYSNDLATVTLSEIQFKKVLDLDPKYLAAHYQLGKLFESLADKEQALHYYKTGLAIAKEKKDLKSAGEFNEAIFLLED